MRSLYQNTVQRLHGTIYEYFASDLAPPQQLHLLPPSLPYAIPSKLLLSRILETLIIKTSNFKFMAKNNNSTVHLPPLCKWHICSTMGFKSLLTLFIFLFFSSFNLWAQDPGKGATKAGFEIDADFKSGFIPSFWSASNYDPSSLLQGDDWSKGTSGNAVLKQSGGVSVPGVTDDRRSIWQVDGNSGSNSAVAEGSTFSGTSNKNGDNIASGQNPYLVELGGSTPQKNDLTNTYLHGRLVAGQLWIFFGAETRSVNGASYVDFEYNQAGVSVVPNGTKFNLVGKGLVGGRTIGDVLLVINYTGGGNKPVVGIRTWQANATWSNELSLTSFEAFVTTNTTDVGPVAPNMSFAGDGAHSDVTGALQFVEGGVNITSLNLGSNFDPCNPLSTVTVKTRSSPSYTSELKDYDILAFSALPPATLTALSPVTACAAGQAIFSTTVSGSGALASNVKWYKVTNGTESEITSSISTSGLTSTLTLSNVTAADAGTYRARLTGADCGSPQTDAALTVITIDCTITAGTGNGTCPGLTNTYSVPDAGAGAIYSWTVTGTPPGVIGTVTGDGTNQISVPTLTCGSYQVSVTVSKTLNGVTCSQTCSQSYNVVDAIAPVITLSLGTDGGTTALDCNPTPAQIDAAFGTATATDNCPTANSTVAVSTSNGTIAVDGCQRSQTRTFTATDACGNTATATRNVAWTADVIAPVITATGTTLTLACNPSAADIEAALGSATATDDCGNVTPTATDGTVISNGCSRSQTRTWNVTDACGNAATPVSRTITWKVDVTAPVITATGSVDNGANLGCNPTADAINGALGSATALDDCDGALTPSAITSDVVVDGCSRSQTRTWNVTDACGNAATPVSRTITWTEDLIPPTISCPANSTVACGGTPTFGTPTVSDNCGGTVDLVGGSVVTTTNQDGTFTYSKTWTATDDCGNTNTCTQTITSTICVTAHIFPTQTTCCNYLNGPTSNFQLSQICMTVSGGKVTNAIPGVFFYYGDYTHTTANGNVTLYVKQTTSAQPFTPQNMNQLRVFVDQCQTVTPTATQIVGGNAIISFNAVQGKKYVISVKYDTKSIVGYTVPNNTVYEFGLSLDNSTILSGSQGQLTAKEGCSDNTGTPSGDCIATPVTVSTRRSDEDATVSRLNVLASPNPYNDNVRFVIKSPNSGKASLEVYNTLGQKLHIVFEGQIQAGVSQTFEYAVPEIYRSTLIYMFRQGGKLQTGKLLQARK
jgi:hypothetical protein